MVASRFRAAALCPASSPPTSAGPAEAACLSDCTPLFVGGDHWAPVVVADFEPPSVAGAGEPLDTETEPICALRAAGRTGPRKLAAGASFVLHTTIAALFAAAPNEVRIAGGRTVEMAVVDFVLAPAPVVETAAPEDKAAMKPEPVEEPPPAEPAPEPDPVETINEAMQLQAPLPEFSPPQPVEIPQPALPEPSRAAETPGADPAPVDDSRLEPLSATKPSALIEQPEAPPEIGNAPELANIPVPRSKPDFAPPEERAEAKPQRPRNVEKSRERPRKRDEKEATPPSRQMVSDVGQRQREAGNDRVSNYPGRVVKKLRRALRYPSAARRDRLRGEANVRFTVLASGAISGVRVTSSSGSPVLDKAAIQTVRRAAPFPDIPPAAGRSSWTFTVPLAFRP